MTAPNFKYILIVMVGAASYGVLATMVKLAYQDGFSISEVLIAQYVLGTAFMGFYLVLSPQRVAVAHTSLSTKTVALLIIGGSAFGLTGYFYYLSLLYIPVSMSVVLLMQTIWIGVVIESVQLKRIPSVKNMVAVLIVLTGTLLATNVMSTVQELHIIGMAWGLLSAATYTVALSLSKSTGTTINPKTKSFYMLMGSTFCVVIAGMYHLAGPFMVSIFWHWGPLLAFFGTIIPPIFLNKGLPATGLGLGAVLISVEIPVSMLMAKFLLGEELQLIQWLGVLLILLSIIIINSKTIKAAV